MSCTLSPPSYPSPSAPAVSEEDTAIGMDGPAQNPKHMHGGPGVSHDNLRVS